MPKRFRWVACATTMALLTFGVVAPDHPATAQTATFTLQRASVGPAGEGNGPSPQDLAVEGPNVATSADGRYVAFSSDATNLLGPGNDTNGATDVFRYDRQTGEVVIVSLSDDGSAGDGPSGLFQVDISADGQVVVFESLATNLTDHIFFGQTPHVFAVDVANRRTVLVSTDGEGQPFETGGIHPSVSSDGRFVVFESQGVIWRQELVYEQAELIGTAGPDIVVRGGGRNPSINGNGRYVVYTLADPQTGLDQVYREEMDTVDGAPTVLVSVPWHGDGAADGNSRTVGPRAISDDGQRVGFVSDASDLDSDRDVIPPDGWDAAYVRDLGDATTRALPVVDGQIQESSAPSLSRDGAFAAFSSPDDLTGEGAGGTQVYVSAIDDGRLTLASASPDGTPGNATSDDAVLNGDGRVVAFGSDANNLVPDDDNGETDVFVRVDSAGIAPENVSLTVEPASGGTGIPEVDLSGVDISTLPLFPGELASAPLRSTPLRSTPLRSTPLRSTPLRSTALPPMPLSTVPLLTDGGWEAVLEGPPATPFAGLPLQSVLLQDVLALPEGTYPQVDALQFEHVDIASTPLRSTSLQTFLFSGVALDDLSPTADWCGALAPDFACADHDIDESTSTLVDLHFAGAPVDDLDFVPGLPVAEADLTGSPAHHYDVAEVNVAQTSLGAIPADQLPIGFVDCTAPATFDCATATLADAVAGGHIIDYDPDAANPAILGRLLTVPAFAEDLTLADVVRMLIDPAKLSFADLPLAPVLLDTPVEDNLAAYTASADVACEAMTELEIEVTLPPGFRYAPESTTLDVDGEQTAWDDPIVDPPDGIDVPRDDPATQPSLSAVGRQRLTWPVWGQACADGSAHVDLAFRAQPWVVLGAQTSALTFTAGSAAVTLPHAAPFTVRDAGEPNDGPDTATQVREGTLYLPHLDSGDRTDVFEVVNADGGGFPRGTIVSAQLSHLPADFDLRLDGPSAAPLRSTPLRSTPLRSTPIEDFGLGEDPAGDVVRPDLVEDVPRDDDTLSQSANRGLADEVVSTVVTAATAGQPVTLALDGYLGESSDEPYALQVFVEDPPELNCVPQTAFAGGTRGSLPDPGSVDPDTRTLVLVNQQRFDALHGTGSTQGVRDAFAALDGDENAGPIAILPVDGEDAVHAAYQAWDADPCEPEAANDVVREIVGVMDEYIQALDQLRFVVMVGDDNIVPSARVPDLVTLSNQRDYYPEIVFDGRDNPQSAAAGYGYVLSDNAYTTVASTPLLGHELLVPELAGGRLVETPAEIVGTIDRYATDPFLDVDRTLVTAYDFLLHGGEQTQTALQELVDAGDARSRLDDDWSVDDLLDDELPPEPDIAALFAHYDHSRLLTAAGDHAPTPTGELLSTTDVLAAGLAEGALLFTVGCNAGLNVPALAWAGATPEEAERLLDWAQTVARHDGTLFANTGFGYGDTTVSAYSERLMALFAELLDGSMTVGQAAVAARRAYLAEAPIDVYTAKVVAESTFYGLPFVRVGADGDVAPPPAQSDPGAADTDPIRTDPLTGLPATAFSVDPEFQTRTGPRGSYQQAVLGGEQQPVLTAISRPLQPAISLGLPATPSGVEVGDLLVTELSTDEEALDDPVFVRPIFDHSEHEPEPLVREVSYPVSLGNVTPAGNLLLSAGQFRSEGLGQGTQTTYTHVAGSVLYVDASEPTPDRPRFTRVEAARFDGSVSVGFVAEVAPAEHVLVLYKPVGESDWRSVQLAETAPGLWTGGVAEVEIEEYFVQAVNGGLVGSARGKGHNFQPLTAADPEGFAFEVEGEPGNNGWYRGPVTVTLADITPGVVYEASLNGDDFSTIDPQTVAVTRDGVNTLEARGSDGSQGRLFVPVDTTPPTVDFRFPADGQEVPADQMDDADFRCADVGSGVDLCRALDGLGTAEGEHTFRVRARDVAGHVTTQQITYEVVPGDGDGDGDGVCPVDVPAPDFSDYADIPTAHVGNVDCAAALGIVQGFTDGEFKPRLPVTRAQMASFIFRTLQAAGVELPGPSGNRFADVGAGSAHDEAIHRLAAAGILQGGPLGMDAQFYGPQLRTRRDQMASFLMRAAGYALEGDPDFYADTGGERFPDVPSTNTHAGNVNAASEVGIALGFEDGLYRPRATTRRDQMSSFVVRLLDFLAD